jgi:hypothetical protein
MDSAVIKYAQREAQLIQMKEQQALYESQIAHLRHDLDNIQSKPHDIVRNDDDKGEDDTQKPNVCLPSTVAHYTNEIV